jgi:isopenicillin N synthase-like dioxygenase
MTDVPIVDLGLDDSRVAAEIGRACRNIGFFYVAHHGVPDAALARLLDASAAFFALPEAEKNEVSIKTSRHNRGYVALGGEALDPSRPGDAKDVFNMGRELAPDDPDLLAGKPFHGSSLWPARPEGFREALIAYFDAMLALG